LPVELALCSGARLFAQRSLQVAFDKATLGPAHRRAADPDARGNLLIADAGVRSQQDLGSLELARRLLAAVLRARFGSVRPDSIPSSVPPRVEARITS
jgi:hypothetical protein